MTDVRFADRLRGVGHSGSQALIGRVRALRAQGIDVIDFGQQEAPPQVARAAACEAVNWPASAFYTDPRGTPELRRTIAAKLALDNGIVADPDAELVVTVGAKQALFVTLLALVERGDEVLLEDPGYLGFEPLVRLAGATPVPLVLSAEDGFRMPVESLRQRITPRTRVMLLCNPHNPTGRVLGRDELDGIAAVAKEFDLVVIMDEAYEHFVFDGRRHVSLASLPDMKARTITVQTMSKVYNMAGWRIGWLVAPAAIAQKILAIHTHAVTCPASMSQAGAEAAIRARVGEGDHPFASIIEKYTRQRDAMVEGLRSIPGISCNMSEGGYFVFPDLKAFGLTSAEISAYLLDAAHVAATPGAVFGAAGEGHLRFVIKSDVPVIRKGIVRIADALSRLRRSR